jgi:7-carboxy-7-deazaguanine synthase
MEKVKNLPIVEIYPCLQGEGRYTGVPSILIRTTGCKLRCQFANSFCDTAYASWSPEKGQFTLSQIEQVIIESPQIHHIIITGGGPTMHPQLLRDICDLGHKYKKIITLETEGSEFVEKVKVNLLSLSPKLKSSTPIIGIELSFSPGKQVKKSHIDQHEKYRTNYFAMRKWIEHSINYQVKFVIGSEDDIFEALDMCESHLHINREKIMFMPAGSTNEQLNTSRKWLVERCIELGINYTDRLHVVVYGDLRGV